MAERKKLGSISVITDCETGMYHLGEIEGGFDEKELENHIRKYGISELTNQLAFMSFQVFKIHRKINSEISSADKPVANN